MPAEAPPKPSPRLLVFTSLERAPRELMLSRFARLSRLAREQSVLFVLRDYELSARERLSLGRELSQVARGSEQLVGVADRADIALLLDADALHVPERGVDAPD
ncbi:MAG TPA: thiamine phosphate synthase, partial [Polyangiaceae bacterium]